MTTSNKKTDDPTEMFVYETTGGDSITLLPFGRLPSGVFRKARKNDDEMDVMFSIVEAAADEANLETVDELSLEELGKLFEAWSEAANTDPKG